MAAVIQNEQNLSVSMAHITLISKETSLWDLLCFF